MKYQPGLFDLFISPVSGRINIAGVQDLEEDYVWIGDRSNKAQPSPIIKDIRLEIIQIRTNLSLTKFILQSPRAELPSAQALDRLNDGMLRHESGVIKIANLSTGKIWIGDENNTPSEQQTISIDNLPDLQAMTIGIGPVSYGIRQMWQGTNSGRPEASYSVSTRLAQIDYAFLTTNWIIGKSGIVPGSLTYPNAQFIELLPPERILTHVSDGVIGVASLSFNKFWIGDENNIPIETATIPIGSLPDLTHRHLWIGDESNRPVETLLIGLDNMPNLTYKSIWRGNSINRPEETQDLTILEGKVTFIQDVTIPGIESEIASIQAEIASIQGEITIIQGQITVLEAAVAVLQGQVLGLLSAVASLNNRVDSLETRVGNIETNVSTLQSQVAVLQGQIIAINTRIDNLSVTLIGDVTGTGNISSPITTELQLTLDQIKKAQNTVDINNNKIINVISDNVEQLDALNAKFLWDLMHDNVGVVWQ